MKYVLWLLVGLLVVAGCGTKPQPTYSASEQFAYARGLYDRGKYYQAQVAFENLIYTYPGDSVIDTAQFYLGMSYFKQKDYGVAAGEFNRLLAAYPNSELADDARYYVGLSHYELSPKYELDQAETYRALEEFQKLLSDYPVSQYRDDANKRIAELEAKLAKKSYMAGRFYFNSDEYQAAQIYFDFVRDNYPATEWAIKAFYYSGEIQLKRGQYNEARETFERFLTGFSNHEFAAKAKERLQEIDKKLQGEKG